MVHRTFPATGVVHYATGMGPQVAVQLVLAAAVLLSPQKVPELSAPVGTTFLCDEGGAIKCSLQQVETVTGSRSLEDMRIIGKFIQLVTERNRRYFLAWHTKSPSPAYELVKRVKAFPYLPYGDAYAIAGLEIGFDQATDRLTVKYPKKPKLGSAARVSDGGFASYETTLSDFIKTLQKEIDKLNKYEK